MHIMINFSKITVKHVKPYIISCTALRTKQYVDRAVRKVAQPPTWCDLVICNSPKNLETQNQNRRSELTRARSRMCQNLCTHTNVVPTDTYNGAVITR